MSDCHTAVGDILENQLLYLGKIRDAVVDKVHLSVTAHLEVNGIGNQFTAIDTQLRMDGVTVGRGCTDDAHVAGTHQGELKRSRYRRCAHRECVDVGLQLTELFLHGNTELLLLVDNQQSEVFPLHILANQLVSANQNVYLSLL